jgi:uncharacterized membrane protein (DUF106 family)
MKKKVVLYVHIVIKFFIRRMKMDNIQHRLSFYENKFNNLIEEIESDTVLKTIEGNHLAGILVQMKKQIDKYLKENKNGKGH